MREDNIVVAFDYASFTMTSAAKTITWSRKANKPLTNEILCQRVDLHLSKLIKALDREPLYFIATCEGNIKDNWRRRIYPKYKESRLDIQPEQRYIGECAKVVKDHLKKTMKDKLIFLEKLNYIEGDDYFIVLSKIFTNLVIVSADKDMRQLVSEDVKVYNPLKNCFEEYQPAHVKDGDISDGIPPALNREQYMKNLELISLFHVPLTIQHDIFYKSIRPVLPDLESPFPKNPLGLCCIHNALKKKGIYASRKPIFDVIRRNGGLEYLISIIEKNLDDLIEILDVVKDMGLTVFRVSSDLMPHMSNPMLSEFSDKEELSKNEKYEEVRDFIFKRVKQRLINVGKHARSLSIRLTFHPGQYNVVATLSQEAFDATVRDLSYHAKVFDYMLMGRDSVMVVHGGGTYNDRELTKTRWVKQFNQLPENVQRRLVIENCERNFSIEDCLEISRQVNIPVVFDIHHHWCWHKIYNERPSRSLQLIIKDVLHTWNKRFIKPKFHVSSQAINSRIGAHADMIVELPSWLVTLAKEKHVDIMIEAKAKEKAVQDLIDRYFKSNHYLNRSYKVGSSS